MKLYSIFLHKLRASMVNPFRDKIGPTNKIEVDETYIGGPTTGGKRGRGTRKAMVIIAVERQGKKAGRVRLRHIKDAKEGLYKGMWIHQSKEWRKRMKKDMVEFPINVMGRIGYDNFKVDILSDTASNISFLVSTTDYSNMGQVYE